MMRIFVHEFVSGGGLAGQAVPPSLAREGRAMLETLIADLTDGGYDVITTADARFPPDVPSGVEVRTWSSATDIEGFDDCVASADAVWIVAPETGRHLSTLVARVESSGKYVIGCASGVISRASDKAGLVRVLGSRAVPYPSTRVLCANAGPEEWSRTAAGLGYPVVIKPRRGAGCEGVRVATGPDELPVAVAAARQVAGHVALLVQQFIPGTPASVSLLGDGDRAMPLTLNRQDVDASGAFSYGGGSVPLEHPLADRAFEVAVAACEAVGGVRGYVGVDLVLGGSEATVIEINPRLTTAYLGVRCAISRNLADMAVRASDGHLPQPVDICQRVRFTAAGRILASGPVPDTHAHIEPR